MNNKNKILYLLNSTDIQGKLRTSPWLKTASWNGDIAAMTREVYLRVLSRPASTEEIKAVSRWFAGVKKEGVKFRTAAESLIWALMNTDEFLFLN